MSHSTLQQTIKSLPKNASVDLKDFVTLFHAKIPAPDLQAMAANKLATIAERHYEIAKKRKPGEHRVSVQNVQNYKGTTVSIIMDDRPFIIDSIVAEIVRQGHLINDLIYPLLYVERDKTGKLKKFFDEPSDKSAAEAHIDAELRSQLTDIQCQELEIGLQQVLIDVDFATRDWIPMREKLREAQKELSKAPKSFDDHLIEEYQAFLEYLYNNNFTLLGYREYKFSNKGGKIDSQIVTGSSLGLLNDEVKPVYVNEARKNLTQPQQKMRIGQMPVTISKVNKRSTVHRRVPLDAVAVKTFDKSGKVTGEMLFIGLFTSVTYARSIGDIPYLRLKAQAILDKSGLESGQHDRKALRHILERYPRDEMLQIDESLLYDHAMSILRLQERPRIALYLRPDPFGRYISCLVYVPRDRYDTRMRLRFQHILEKELGGVCANYQVNQDDSTLARVLYHIDINQLTSMPDLNQAGIEAELEEAGRVWAERLRSALEEAEEINTGDVAILTRKYGMAFPISYHERYQPKQAVHDIVKIEEVLTSQKIALNLYRPADCEPQFMRLKIFSPDTPVTLSDILPVLENMGLRVLAELPFEIQPAKLRQKIWIHDFQMECAGTDSCPVLQDVKEVFEEALAKIWAGDMDNDGLNKLVLSARMPWRDIMLVRAYVRYMPQIRVPYSRAYIEEALTAQPAIAAAIIKLFKGLHDPSLNGQNDMYAAGASVEIDHLLEKVDSLDQDRILRLTAALVEATLRTNFFQNKAHLSFKLEPKKVPDLPEPKPYREIFVYSSRVEGVHLRGDKIARGGLRWSDRHEDYRTEVLGLMKAQQVKNAVIVPMGAKGGFVVKNPPPKELGRKAYLEEGIECYKIYIRALLDITDNRSGDTIIPPKDVVRRDGDDPYLVVAADKGTASFSDIANALSLEYGFWLGDAFASGGSAGYDHKKMGITARGAWESVKRHFRELNHNTQTQEFDVIGVGDMGGDVFGNGMLLSEKIRLVGAFNHVHIFCDPDPNPAESFKERLKLFESVTGWEGYDIKKLSKGGRIYNRTEKSLQLTPEIQKRFALETERVTPTELIRAMLKARTDLLWFGGIGTYIKATKETHGDVGDKGNDALRINAAEVHAKVIGEGANLALTQRARIEMAENGVKLNADYIDNSGGVDSSDHEVNIKILTGEIMRKPKYAMDVKKRNKLLAAMTDDVAAHVLRNNYQQSQAISLMELQASDMLAEQEQLMQDLEKHMGLNRVLEGLPEEEAIAARLRAGKGLTRPELAVLQAYAKIRYTRALLESDIPESKAMEGRLLKYFPAKLVQGYADEIKKHQLRREIICTTLANSMVNRMGPTFMMTAMEKGSASAAEVARAYIIVREAFGLRDIWSSIEALDTKVPAMVQLKALKDTARMVERGVTWFLTRMGRALDINKDIAAFEKGIDALKKNFEKTLTPMLKESIDSNIARLVNDGLPQALAHDIAIMPLLASACDIIRISLGQKTDMAVTARTYFEIGEHFHLDWMRNQARYITADDRWSAEALDGLTDQLYSAQAGLTVRILKDSEKSEGKSMKVSPLGGWLERNQPMLAQIDPLLTEMRRTASLDLPMLIIAEQRLRHLFGG